MWVLVEPVWGWFNGLSMGAAAAAAAPQPFSLNLESSECLRLVGPCRTLQNPGAPCTVRLVTR